MDRLQACVDEVIPEFLQVVQGSIQEFVGPADHSEQDRREHMDMMLRTMGELQGGLKRMNHVRREMVQVGASEPGTAGVVDAETAVRVRRAVREVADCFGVLEDAMGEAEALPSSLVELLDRGRSEMNAILLDGEDEVPDHVGPEVAGTACGASKVVLCSSAVWVAR